METSLTKIELSQYIRQQLLNNFPDNDPISLEKIISYTNRSLEKLDNCLSKFSLSRYKKDTIPYFNHLYSDSYMLFLAYLSNTIWEETKDTKLASKVYYLNKIMHSFDCMYNNIIPEVFMIHHGIGTVMGKAEYGNYFMIYQGCTIGSSNGVYPKIGNGVTVAANASIIGNCTISDRVTISTRTTIFEKDIPKDSLVYNDHSNGKLEIKKTTNCYAQKFFMTDLNELS